MKVLSADGLTKFIQLVKSTFSTKQDNLISGTNIKTINNQSLLGSGNLTIQSGSSYTAGDYIDITNNVISGKVSTNTSLAESLEKPYYAWTYNNTTYYTESSTPTVNNDLYTIPSTNTFVKSTTSEIKSVSSGSISIKEDKDYQAWTYNGTTYYTLGENPSVGDTLYIKENGEFISDSFAEITAISNNTIDITVSSEITLTLEPMMVYYSITYFYVNGISVTPSLTTPYTTINVPSNKPCLIEICGEMPLEYCYIAIADTNYGTTEDGHWHVTDENTTGSKTSGLVYKTFIPTEDMTIYFWLDR